MLRSADTFSRDAHALLGTCMAGKGRAPAALVELNSEAKILELDATTASQAHIQSSIDCALKAGLCNALYIPYMCIARASQHPP